MSTGEAWVELVGDLVIARVRGEPTEALLKETQDKVLFLVRDAQRGKVLYDTLEMLPPPVDVPWSPRSSGSIPDQHQMKTAVACRLPLQ